MIGRMATTTPSRTVLPPEQFDQLLDLSKFLETSAADAALLGPDGQQVPLPMEMYEVLVDVARAMRAGQAVSVIPIDKILTTQEAADFLGVSRPTLVTLLENGRIPFQRSGQGRHRRVRLQDLLEYREATQHARRKALDALTEAAAAEGLYDAAPSAKSAQAVIKNARRRAG